MKVIVVGCGRLGSDLAYRLFQAGHEVTVIDNAPNAFNNLKPDFRGRQVEGDALSKDILHRAGMKDADAVAVMTNCDPLNAVIAHIAQTIFNRKNVVVRNYDPLSRDLLETFNLQIVCSATWGAQRVEELIYHADAKSIFSTGNGEVELYEFRVPDAWDGKMIKDVITSKDCMAVSLAHVGRAILPQPDSIMHSGDVLLLSATSEGIEIVRKNLAEASQKKEG
ncbi:MAG TPA: TrkA family potassium uptake protein [Anaerolineaceae bacterium]|nr:TrkA family potassium uptake protein [Anaerolineaceae bacterium]HPN50620.1 TrkA family potassium uptake protein [Anaerolineaceae bacterium]